MSIGWKKEKKIIFTLLLFLLSACVKENKQLLTGVYYPVSCTSSDGEEYEIEDEFLKIEEDGEGYFFLYDTKYEIHWEIKDGKLFFEDSSGDTFVGTYKDGIIEGDYFNEIHYVFSLKEGNE